jgi:hypothetical protein
MSDSSETKNNEADRSPGKRPRWHYALGFAVAALALLAAGAFMERLAAPPHVLAYLTSLLFGMLVGTTELVARYRDKPTAPLMTLPGSIYIGVNGAVSLILAWLLNTGEIATNLVNGFKPELNQVLLAGFGGMALFRTSLFTLRVKDTDIAIGPAAVLQIILRAADRACDRDRAGPRAERVKKIMQGVSYAQAKSALVPHCFQLMQNFSAAEAAEMKQAISVLDGESMRDQIKAYNLGLLLMNYVGETVLEKAVAVTCSPVADEPAILAQASTLKFEDMRRLVDLCEAFEVHVRTKDVKKSLLESLEVNPAMIHDVDKNIVVLGRLRRVLGADTVDQALKQLARNNKDIAAKPSTEPLSRDSLTL